MIIKKNIKSSKKQTSQPEQSTKAISKANSKSSRLLKNKDLIPAMQPVEIVEEPVVQQSEEPVKKPTIELEDFEKIDISEIEFSERVERRRGDRRRGYRRIDERSLVSRAQQEAHSIKELAAREGYQNGFSQAGKEISEIKTSLLKFLNMKNDMYEKFYPHIVEIALAATEKIIKKEVEIPNEVLKNVVISAMDELNSDTQKVEIKVNSSDIEFAKVSLPEIIEANNSGIKVLITQDDKVDSGSCILIANNGVIDATFKTQLAVLQNAFGIYKGGL